MKLKNNVALNGVKYIPLILNMASYNINDRIQFIITTSIIDDHNIVRMLHEYNRIPDARLAVLLAS